VTNERLTHVSFFAGIGGFDLGLHRAGWRTVAYSEIDPYAISVFESRFPGVPNLGDITKIAVPDIPSTPDSGYGLERSAMRDVRLGRLGAWQTAT
jgi:DNA (cytosine-5)-methyltransferase 1